MTTDTQNDTDDDGEGEERAMGSFDPETRTIRLSPDLAREREEDDGA